MVQLQTPSLVELEDLRDQGVRIISIGDNIDYPTYDDWTAIQFRFLINEMPVTDAMLPGIFLCHWAKPPRCQHVPWRGLRPAWSFQHSGIADFVSRKFPQSALTFYEDRDRSGYTFEQREGYQAMRPMLISVFSSSVSHKNVSLFFLLIPILK